MQQVLRKTLTGAWEEFEFDGYGRRFFVKNFTEGAIFVKFDVNEVNSYKIASGTSEKIATSYNPIESPSYYKKSIWVNGEGEVEVEQMDTSAPMVIYNALTVTVSDVTASKIELNGAEVEEIPAGLRVGDELAITYEADEHYSLPETVNVEGAQYTWTSGVLTLTKASDEVSVDIEGVADEYDITYALTGVTGSNPAKIVYGDTVSLVFAYEEGYENATASASDGTLTGSGLEYTLTGVTADTTITVTATEIQEENTEDV